jgi:hypothetical protein
MSSLIPFLQDIIPMLRPGKVQVVKSTELDEGTGQTEGMIRKGAIVGMSDHLCASGKFVSLMATTKYLHIQNLCCREFSSILRQLEFELLTRLSLVLNLQLFITPKQK